MKKYLILFPILLFACKQKDCCAPDPDTEELRLEQMDHNWNVEQVLKEQTDMTSDWNEFILGFRNDKTFETSNSADLDLWPVEGSFDFLGETGAGLDAIERNDGIVIYIDAIGVGHLDLTISTSVKGQWHFHLKN